MERPSKHGEVASMHCTTVHETEAVANKINPCVLIYDISCKACTCMHLHPLCGTTLRPRWLPPQLYAGMIQTSSNIKTNARDLAET
jgi:hypothetical protein